MCNAQIIESIKSDVASQHYVANEQTNEDSALSSAILPLFGASGQDTFRIIDMTHTLHPNFPTYSGEIGFRSQSISTLEKDGINILNLSIDEHTGTHLDAPLHCSDHGSSVAEIPVNHLICPLCVIDIAVKADANPDAQLTPDDLAQWISRYGPIPPRACIAMHSNWAARIKGKHFRNADDSGKMHFPGFHIEAINMLLGETKAVGIAVDTLSLDYGLSEDFAVHRAWLPRGYWGLENIAHLDNVPAMGASIIVGAPKHQRGTGGPTRVFAII